VSTPPRCLAEVAEQLGCWATQHRRQLGDAERRAQQRRGLQQLAGPGGQERQPLRDGSAQGRGDRRVRRRGSRSTAASDRIRSRAWLASPVTSSVTYKGC
jgi:hypothetical protein